MSGDRETHRRAVVVISSHVARGSVGNRAAVLTFEHLGFPVWAVPTVVLPWHPGHGPATRIVPPPEQFSALMRDLETAPWLDEVGAVLSGYLGDASQADAVASFVKILKARNPETIYLCDPVCGDENGLYVPQETANAIREKLLPLADIATPNRFELEWLAGGASLADNTQLARAALDLGPSTVLVTSAHALMAASTGNLLVTERDLTLAEHRLVQGAPNGTGDLAAAHFLAGILGGRGGAVALQATTAAVFEMVARAVKRGSDELMLETDSQSLSHPMAMVQIRRMVHPFGNRRA